MIKQALLDYVAEVSKQHTAVMAKFNEGIKAGHILHTLQWQTVQVATAIHEQHQANVLGPNEKVANMLARLIGDDHRAVTSALLILMGLQEFLDSGKPESVALFWEPVVAARKLKKEWSGQAYRKACEILAQCAGPEDENYRLYKDVCQILLNDPEQEKIAVDRKK